MDNGVIKVNKRGYNSDRAKSLEGTCSYSSCLYIVIKALSWLCDRPHASKLALNLIPYTYVQIFEGCKFHG